MTVVRKAVIENFEAVKHLNNQVHRKHVIAKPDVFREIENPLNLDFFSIEIGKDHIFVLESDDVILGYAFVRIVETKDHPVIKDKKILLIEDLCIGANYKRKGLGKILFTELEKYAKENNCTSIELTVWDFNDEAKQFYEKMEMEKTIIRMKKILQ